MALLFCDGFDHYNPGTDPLNANKWTQSGGGGGGTWTQVTGRISGFAVRLTRGNAGGNAVLSQAHILPTATPSTVIVGTAFRAASIVQLSDIIAFDDANTSTTQIQIRISSNGAIRVLRNGTQIGTDSAFNVIVTNVWHFIEAKVVIASGTSGSVQVWVDSVRVLNITSVNTLGSTNAWANKVVIGDRSNNQGSLITYDYDDFYWLDTTTGLGNAGNPLGDCRVVTLLPSGNSGDTSGHDQWTQVGGTPGSFWTSVNEATPDGDSSYVSSLTVNQIENFTHPAMPAAVSTIYGVQFDLIARKDDVGNHTIAPTQRNSTTDSVGATSSQLTSTYVNQISVAENSLQTGSAWTISEVNASEFGVKLIS